MGNQSKIVKLDALPSRGDAADNAISNPGRGLLEKLAQLRSALHRERAIVYRALGDSISYSQCLEAAITLCPSQALLSMYKRDLESRGNQQELNKFTETMKRLGPQLTKEKDSRDRADFSKGTNTTQICLKFVLQSNDASDMEEMDHMGL